MIWPSWETGRRIDSLHHGSLPAGVFRSGGILGDPDFAKLPVAQLIDKKYGAAWRDSIDEAKSHSEQELEAARDLQRIGAICGGASSAAGESRVAAHHTLFRGGCGG